MTYIKKNKVPWISCNTDEMDKCCNQICMGIVVHLTPQYFYCMNHDSEISIDHILKYESLDTDFMKFIKIYENNKSTYDFMKNNIYNKINIKKTYNIHENYPNLIDKIYEIYEKDFVYFGYNK